MKKILSSLLLAAVIPAAHAQETATGRSGPFAIDTRSGDFKIGDVRSEACFGAYGIKGGKRATFLNGVEAWVDFEVTVASGDEDVEITGLDVMGTEYSERTFRFDVGSLAVGTPLEVVAKGVWKGEEVESDAFRVNLDVARQPMVFGLENLAFRYAGREGYVEAGRAKFQLGKKTPHVSTHPWWLPAGQTGFSPLVALKSEFSRTHGTLTFTPGLYEMTGTHKVRTRKKNGQFGKSLGIDFGFGVDGTMVFRWDPALLAWVGDGIGLQGEVNGGTDWTFPFAIPTPIGPIPMFAEVGVEAALQAGLTYHGAGVAGGEERESSWEWSVASEQMPTLSGALGIGANHVADVKGGIKANGMLQGSIGGPDGKTLAYGIKGTLFGTVEVLGWSGTLSTDSDTFWFFGGENAKGVRGRNAGIAWAPMGRSYLVRGETGGGAISSATGEGARPPSGARPTNGAHSPFATGGYPNPAPSVACGGGADWMAYLRDDGTRSDADRTEVVVQSGADGEWGAVERPWNDGTADWMPSLGMAGDGTAVLAWANAKRAWGTATPEFADVCKGLELAVAVRDASTGAWSARNLTDDEALDASPTVCAAEDGTAMVAWLRNAGGALFGSAESPTAVVASRWDGSAWSAPVELGRGTVPGLDLAYDGTNGCVVWTFDGDGDLETAGDVGVTAAVWNGVAWGAASVLAEGLEGASPVVARIDGWGRPSPDVVWGVDGVLWERAADGAGEAVAAPVAWSGAIPETARAVHGEGGALGLAWEGDGNPVAMGYDAEMGLWGGPVEVGEGEAGRMARGVSAARGADGTWCGAWESVAVATNAEGDVAFGDTELRWASLGVTAANPGIRADGFAFATNEVVAGELTGIRVMVRNTGSAGMSNVALRVWACDGELEEDEDARWELLGADGEPVSLDLSGGAEVAATVMWMAEDYRTNLAFVARVEVPEGAEDADASDNVAVWRPGMPALRLENARCEAVESSVRLLTATVRNGGLAPAEAGTAVSFRLDAPDGEEVGRDVAGVVQAGEDHGYDAGIVWDMAGGAWTGAWVTVYAVLDTGDAEADASTAVPIRVMTPLDRDGEGLLDGEEAAMGTDPLEADTNGDGISDYEHVYVWFTDPLAGMGGAWTTNTPVKVPYSWLEEYPEALAEHGNDYEAFAADTAANGQPVWACYVTGLAPTNAVAEFKAVLKHEDGKWSVLPNPDLNEGGTKTNRVYRVEGTELLGDETSWGPTNAASRFFRLKVSLPEE